MRVLNSRKIAIDLGYGDTKVMANGKLFKFPSAISQVRQSLIQAEKKDTFLFNGIEYEVGSKALRNAVATRGYLFLQKYSPLLIFNALLEAQFDLKKPIEIATGLSLVNQSEAQDFLKHIESFVVNDIQIKPQISLFAQGQGIYNEANIQSNGLVCVIDIGYNTFDFLVFENNQPKVELCFANKMGANLAIVDLQKLLIKEFKVDFSEQEAKEVFLKKEVRIAGKSIDFTDIVNSAIQNYTNFIFDELFSKSGDTLKKAEAVIIGGGGAYFLTKEHLEQVHNANYVFSDNPEFANVRGYYKGSFSNKE